MASETGIVLLRRSAGCTCPLEYTDHVYTGCKIYTRTDMVYVRLYMRLFVCVYDVQTEINELCVTVLMQQHKYSEILQTRMYLHAWAHGTQSPYPLFTYTYSFTYIYLHTI